MIRFCWCLARLCVYFGVRVSRGTMKKKNIGCCARPTVAPVDWKICFFFFFFRVYVRWKNVCECVCWMMTMMMRAWVYVGLPVWMHENACPFNPWFSFNFIILYGLCASVSGLCMCLCVRIRGTSNVNSFRHTLAAAVASRNEEVEEGKKKKMTMETLALTHRSRLAGWACWLGGRATWIVESKMPRARVHSHTIAHTERDNIVVRSRKLSAASRSLSSLSSFFHSNTDTQTSKWVLALASKVRRWRRRREKKPLRKHTSIWRTAIVRGFFFFAGVVAASSFSV